MALLFETMNTGLITNQQRHKGQGGFSLIEALISLAVMGMAAGGIIYGYLMASQRAEWSAYSLAAQSLAMQRVEQTRSAKWDPLGYPAVDELQSANFPQQVEILDIPITSSKPVLATNFTTISTLSSNPPLKMILVECVWSFQWKSVHTNKIVTYRAPDQ